MALADLEGARQDWLESLELVRSIGRHGALPSVLGSFAIVELRSSRPDRAVQTLRQATETAHEIGHTRQYVENAITLAWLLTNCGCFAEAEQCEAGAVEAMSSDPLPLYELYLAQSRSERHLLAGDGAAATRAAQAELDLARNVSAAEVAAALVNVGEAHVLEGHREEAVIAFEDALANTTSPKTSVYEATAAAWLMVLGKGQDPEPAVPAGRSPLEAATVLALLGIARDDASQIAEAKSILTAFEAHLPDCADVATFRTRCRAWRIMHTPPA